MDRLPRQIFSWTCRRGHKIDLVQDGNVPPALKTANQQVFMNKRLGRRVEDDEHKIGVRQRLASLLNANTLGFVGRLAQARSIDQVHRNATNGNLFGDQIARGSRSCRDDGSFAFHKAIEERGLADIGLPDDRERESAADNPAPSERCLDWRELCADRPDAVEYLGVRHNVDVVFREIDPGLQCSDQRNQRVLCRLDATRERASQLARGDPGLINRLRLDQVANSLGLSQIDAAGKKSSLREFARLGKSRAALDRLPQEQVEDHRRTVRRYFDDVFSCVGVGCAEEGDDGFVDTTPARRARIQYLREARLGMGQWASETQHRRGDGNGVRPRQANDAYTSAARRSRDGNDRFCADLGLLHAS